MKFILASCYSVLYFLFGFRIITGRYFTLKLPCYYFFPAIYLLYSLSCQMLAIFASATSFVLFLISDALGSLLLARLAFVGSRQYARSSLSNTHHRFLRSKYSFYLGLLFVSSIYSISNVHYLFAIPFLLLLMQPIGPLINYARPLLLISTSYLLSSYFAQQSFGDSSILSGNGNPVFWTFLNLSRLIPYFVSFVILYSSRLDYQPPRFHYIPLINFSIRFVLPLVVAATSFFFFEVWNSSLVYFLQGLSVFLYPFVLVVFKAIQRADYLLYITDIAPRFGDIIPDRVGYLSSAILSPFFSLFNKLGIFSDYAPYDLSFELSQYLRDFGVFNLSIPSFLYFLLSSFYDYAFYILFLCILLILSFSNCFSRLVSSAFSHISGEFLILFFLTTFLSSTYDSRLLEWYALSILLFLSLTMIRTHFFRAN
jgi:hypothetical protein